MHALQKEGDDAYRLEAFDFGRRMAVEREYRAALPSAPPSNVLFDATGRFLIYPSVAGARTQSAPRWLRSYIRAGTPTARSEAARPWTHMGVS